MAVRIPNLVKKKVDQPQFSVSCPSWWDSNEQQIPLSLSKNICFKVESPPKVYHEAKHVGFQLLEHESSSSQSIGHSHSDVSASGGTSSRDQCISTESGQDEMNGAGAKLKSLFALTTPDIAVNPSQTDSHLMVDPPYAYAEPYLGGLFTTYGPHTVIHPQLGSQIVGTTALRVPLELADDGPIYVNAKQYHGILRRRQSRAKLEAQNKLVRSRKPYLHESRHLHALKRVRGTGGRFLSSKELQQPGTTSNHCKYSVMNTIQSHQEDSTSVGTCHPRSVQSGSSNTSCSDISNISHSDVFYRQSNPQFSGMVTHIGGSMQSGGGVMCNGTNHCAPVVR